MSEIEVGDQIEMPVAPPAVKPPPGPSHARLRFAIWGIALVIFAAFVSLTRVHTYLGVEAVAWDKSGRDYVWRVWWRARHDMIGSMPSTLFVVIYLGLIAAFVVLSGLALWLALVPDERQAQVEPNLPLAAVTE